MRQQLSRWWAIGVALSLAALLSACATTSGASTGTGTGTGTGTASATATATSAAAATATPVTAPPHAFAWHQIDSHHVPQIWASVNGAAPRQITHVVPDGSMCDDQIAWSPPVFSPNLTHIVASMGSYNCGDGDLQGPVSIITVSGGSVTTLNSSYQMRTSTRSAGWLNNSTIWFATFSGVYKYTLGGGAPTQIGSVTHVEDAVVRGSTLYMQTSSFSSSSSTTTYSIVRYDLGSNTLLSGSINQGQTGSCQCSAGDAHGPGWDVSPDGAHLVYQYVTPNHTSSGGITSSKIYYAASNGSSSTHIAQAMVTTATCVMQFSWDGQWVAFTEAPPSPATLTASVNSSGGSGDPTFHGYSPDTSGYPVWKWDNTQFWATASSGVERFNRGGSAAMGVSGGLNPWYTIGS